MSCFETKEVCILLLQLLPILVPRKSLWWMVSSGKSHPAHTWAFSSAFSFQMAKMSLWAHTWNCRLGYEFTGCNSAYGRNSFTWEGDLARVVVFGLAIDGVWRRTVKLPPGLAGTVLQQAGNIKGATATRALERWQASDKHWSNLESFVLSDVISSFVGIIWFMENVTYNYVSHLFVLFLCKDGLWFGKSTRWLTADVISCFPDIWINCP